MQKRLIYWIRAMKLLVWAHPDFTKVSIAGLAVLFILAGTSVFAGGGTVGDAFGRLLVVLQDPNPDAGALGTSANPLFTRNVSSVGDAGVSQVTANQGAPTTQANAWPVTTRRAPCDAGCAPTCTATDPCTYVALAPDAAVPGSLTNPLFTSLVPPDGGPGLDAGPALIEEMLLAPDGGLVQGKGSASGAKYVHEVGVMANTNASVCVLCSTVGDGGVLAVTGNTRIILSTIDQNGSPVQFANGVGCGSFGTAGIGDMLPANGKYKWNVLPAPDGGLSTFYTCCAQTATASPTGPFLCAEPDTQ